MFQIIFLIFICLVSAYSLFFALAGLWGIFTGKNYYGTNEKQAGSHEGGGE